MIWKKISHICQEWIFKPIYRILIGSALRIKPGMCSAINLPDGTYHYVGWQYCIQVIHMMWPGIFPFKLSIKMKKFCRACTPLSVLEEPVSSMACLK